MRQLSLDEATLRIVASGISPRLPPVMRWRKLLRRLGPPPGAQVSVACFRGVGSVLADHADRNGRSCFPSVATIAGEAGYSPRAVAYAIAALEDRGLLVRFRRGRRATSYVLLAPGGEAVDDLGTELWTNRPDLQVATA